MNKRFKAPTTINLEITDLCNARCRHCYNFWREDSSEHNSMDIETMGRLIDIFIEAEIFHVVLTGGEPFLNMRVLKYSLKRLHDNNISTSCNSNLMLATEDKVKRLRDCGLDHILTSLNSYDAETNDYMVNKKGALEIIKQGIRNCVKNSIRVSANMIISQRNKEHIYQTGLLAHELGCQKIFGTRVVPSVNVDNVVNTDSELSKDDAIEALNQLVRIKEETGIMIGSLVSYPLCFLGDLERFKDFVGRGCTGQSGHLMSINANGDAHACVHQAENYGNVFKGGIFESYKKMCTWHDKSYRYAGCMDCGYIEVCKSGCRMSAHAYFGAYNKQDQLMVGKDGITKQYKIVYDDTIYEKIKGGLKFTVPKRLRFRKEDGFHLVSIRWANIISIVDEVAVFLRKYQDSGSGFGIGEFGEDKVELLAQLFFKDVVESSEVSYGDLRSKDGFSIDPSDM